MVAPLFVLLLLFLIVCRLRIGCQAESDNPNTFSAYSGSILFSTFSLRTRAHTHTHRHAIDIRESCHIFFCHVLFDFAMTTAQQKQQRKFKKKRVECIFKRNKLTPAVESIKII